MIESAAVVLYAAIALLTLVDYRQRVGRDRFGYVMAALWPVAWSMFVVYRVHLCMRRQPAIPRARIRR